MEACLGVALTEGPNDPIWEEFAGELKKFQDARERTVRLMAAGGRDLHSMPALEPTWRPPFV